MKDIEEWARKAREVLEERRVIWDNSREFDDHEVIALCEEYDEIVRKILEPELCPTCNEQKDRNAIARIIGEESEGPLYCPNGFHNV